MNISHQRLELILKGRLYITLAFAVSSLLIAFIIKSPIIPYLLILYAFHFVFNQPYFWKRIIKTELNTIAQIITFGDILGATVLVGLFGGTHSGPFVGILIVIIFQATFAFGPKAGLQNAALALVLLFILVFLQNTKIIEFPPGLIEAGKEIQTAQIISIVIVTCAIFIMPALLGFFVNEILKTQEIETADAVSNFEKAFNEALVAIMIIDEQGIIKRANPAFAKLLGMDLSDIQDKQIAEVISPESTDDFAVIIQNAQSGDYTLGKGLPLHLLDGTQKYIEIFTRPHIDLNRNPAVLVSIRDVTEKHNMEEELKRYSEELYRIVEERTLELEESRESYASLFENAAVPLCWLDPYGILQSANGDFKKLTGLNENCFTKFCLVEIIADSDAQMKLAKIFENLRRGYEAPTRFEFEIYNTYGETAWTEWFIRFDPLTDQLLVSMIDQTERNKAEKELEKHRNNLEELVQSRTEEIHEQQNFLEAIFETATDGIFVLDRHMNYIFINRAYSEIMGEKAENWIGKIAGANLLSEDNPLLKKAFDKALAKTFQFQETRLKTIDGNYRTLIIKMGYLEWKGQKHVLGIVNDITERKKSREALYASEQRFRTAANIANDIIFEWDIKNDYFKWYGDIDGMLGYEPGEFPREGQETFLMIHPDDRDNLRKKVNEHIKSENPFNDEYRIKTKTGDYKYVSSKGIITKDENGKPKKWIGINTDINEKKIAEQELKASEETLRTLIQNSPDFIVTLDKDGIITFLNQTKFAKNPDELVGHPVYEFLNEDEGKFTKDFIDRIFESGKPEEFERFLEKQNYWLSTRVIPIKSDGKVESLMAIATDITAKKESEEAVKEAEERYKALFTRSMDCVFVHDLEGNFIDANQAALDLLGYSKEEINDLNFATLLDEDYYEPAFARVHKILETGMHKQHDEYKLYAKGGREIFIETKGSLLYRFGKPYAIQGIARDITDRKHAEQALRESETRYRMLAENVTDLIWTTDLSINLLFITPSVTKMLGYLPDEVIGTSVFNYFTDDSRDLALGILAEELAEDKKRDPYRARTIEMQCKHQQGHLIWTEVRVTFLRDESENPSGILGTLSNIQKRIDSQEELKKYQENLEELVIARTEELKTSEKNYMSLFEESLDPIYISTREGKFIDANKAALELFGYTKKEFLKIDVADVYAVKEDRFDFVEAIEDKGALRNYEVQFIKKDGTVIYCLLSSTVRKSIDGKILGYQGIIKDISDMKTAQRELLESEERYKSLADTSSDAITLISLKGDILALNKGALDIFNHSTKEDVVGRSGFENIDMSDQEKANKYLMQIITEGKFENIEFTMKRDDGSTFPCEVSASIIKDLDDKPVSIMTVMRDLTEQKENEKLQNKLQGQLVQAEKMATAGQIAAGMAHEMNNPLTAINYYSQSLEKISGLDPKEEEKIARIRESSERIQDMVSKLLNYASPEKAVFSDVDLHYIVRQAMDSIAHEIEKRPGVKINTQLDEIPFIKGSTIHLYHLLSNLLINAVQALPVKNGVINITVRKNDKYVELEVSDNGYGIKDEDLPNIFNPFFSKKPGKEGTGLGLAIVNEAVKLHGANIEVISGQDKGAKFIVRFSILNS